MIRRLAVVAITLALVTVACDNTSDTYESGSEPDDGNVAPRFVPATGSLAALVGTTFEPSPWLPPELGGDRTDPLGGATLLNGEAELVGDRKVMHWLVEDNYANFVVSQRANDAPSDPVIWQPVTAWRLELESGMIVTVGTTVCMPPVHTYDWQNGEFVAVTNRAQDQALGAWTMTVTGPTPYAGLDELICERFVP